MLNVLLGRRQFIKGAAALAAPAIITRKALAAPFSSVRAGNVLPTSYPVALDATKTWLVDKYGRPCFGCGDAPQMLMQMLQQSDVEVYLSNRYSYSINIAWMILADEIYATNPPNNAFGQAPFSGGDFVNFQSPYWNYIDYVMQRALYWGVTVLAMPAFMGLNQSSGYFANWYNASNATLQNYASFLGNRYKNCPNLIWVLGGDADPNDATMYAKLNTFAVALKSADPGHLMTLEASRFTDANNASPGSAAPNGGYSSVDAHSIAYGSTQSWLDINWVYNTGPTVTSGAQRAYSQGKPCLFGEGWYELEHSETAQGIRQQAYGSVFGGSTLGNLFGNGQIWPFNSPNSGNGTTPTWQSQIVATGSIDQQIMGNLLRSREHWLLVPDLSNVTMTSGASNGSVCARTSDGQTILIYIPNSQTVTILMSKITDAGSQANCNWYDPQTGNITAIGLLANSGSHNFTSPNSNDWVLVIDSNAANLKPPGTT